MLEAAGTCKRQSLVGWHCIAGNACGSRLVSKRVVIMKTWSHHGFSLCLAAKCSLFPTHAPAIVPPSIRRCYSPEGPSQSKFDF